MILDDEALVERVARAIRSEAGGDLEMSRWTALDLARAAIEAVRVHMWDDMK